MKNEGSSLTAMQGEILQRLSENGPRVLGSLHRGWPMTRYHARLIVQRLAAAGLVEVIDVDGSPWTRRVSLTEEGRRVAAAPLALSKRPEEEGGADEQAVA